MPAGDTGSHRLSRGAVGAIWQSIIEAPHLADRMDGSQKLPQRLLGTIRDRLAAGGGFTRAALGVAAWMRYASGRDDNGRPIDVQDPLADRFRDTATGARGSWRSLMDGFLEIREVFDEGLARNDAFRSVLSAQLRTLSTQGSIAAISSVSSASD